MRKRERVSLRETFRRVNRATWDEYTPDPFSPFLAIAVGGIWYWITGIPESKNMPPPSEESN